MLDRFRPWATSVIYAIIAAVLLHFARFYPWHRLYLSRSNASLFEHLPPASDFDNVSCFLPRKAALRSAQVNHSFAIGSVDKAGLDREHCVHYASRFTPYLAAAWGNTYIAEARQRLGLPSSTHITNDLIWYANVLAENDAKRYPHIDWSKTTLPQTCAALRPAAVKRISTQARNKRPRVAFVLRLYQDYVWTEDAILHLRALVWELRTADLSFDVDVHLLVEVKDAALYISMFSSSGRNQFLRGNVPIEFWSMVTLWSEHEMTLRYPLYGDFRSGIKAAGSYRACLLAIQRFAVQHPEYSDFVNWEMDTRFTHTYDHLLETVYAYAFHAQANTYTQWPVDGKVSDDTLDDHEGCRNKSADVIVFSPLRNPQNSGWYWEYDVQGFDSSQSTARSASVTTNMWISRRAILALEDMTADRHQSMFCEAMAPSLAFQSPLRSVPQDAVQCAARFKVVHFPHPVAFKYQASPSQLNRLLNPSRAILSKHNEEPLKDTSYYYASSIARPIYEQWKLQTDACMPPLVLHPIKSVSQQTELHRSTWLRAWFFASDSLSLCDQSTHNECVEHLDSDIKRYLRRSLSSPAPRSLHRWDLEHPRYISKKPWIMNSSTKSLVTTLSLLVTASVVLRFVWNWIARPVDSLHSDYLPLATR